MDLLCITSTDLKSQSSGEIMVKHLAVMDTAHWSKFSDDCFTK